MKFSVCSSSFAPHPRSDGNRDPGRDEDLMYIVLHLTRIEGRYTTAALLPSKRRSFPKLRRRERRGPRQTSVRFWKATDQHKVLLIHFSSTSLSYTSENKFSSWINPVVIIGFRTKLNRNKM